MFIEIEKASNRILSHEKPVLFIDTCSILNVFNSLHQSNLSETYVLQARALMQHHEKDVWLTTSQTVYEEWVDNVDSVTDTMRYELTKLDRNMSTVFNVANSLLNASYQLPQHTSSLNLATHIRAHSEKLLKSCLILERTDEHSIRAMHRVRKNEAPAKKGKPEPKDCEIIECFLELGKSLRNQGFHNKLLFFTANEKDFGTRKSLKPPLDDEFKHLNAELINNIDHALALAIGAT